MSDLASCADDIILVRIYQSVPRAPPRTQALSGWRRDPLGQREEVQMSVPEQAGNDKWDLWIAPAGIKAVPFQSASNEITSVWNKRLVLVLHAVKCVGPLSLVNPRWVLTHRFLEFYRARSHLWTLPCVSFHLTAVFNGRRRISAGKVKSKHARRKTLVKGLALPQWRLD